MVGVKYRIFLTKRGFWVSIVAGDSMKPDYKDICIGALDWAKEHDYSGYSKFDALNSTLLKKN